MFYQRLINALHLLRQNQRAVAGVVCIYTIYFAIYSTVLWRVEPTSKQAIDLSFGLIGGFLLPLTNALMISSFRASSQPGESQAVLQPALQSWLTLFTAYLGIGLIFVGYLALGIIPTYGLMMLCGVTTPVLLAVPGLLAALWVFGRFVFVDPLIVLEGKRPWQARQESIALVKDDLSAVLSAVAVLYLPPFVMDMGSEFLTGTDSWGGTPASRLIGGLLSLGAAVLYLVPLSYFYVYFEEKRQKSKAA
jgi:hypothetical protein